MYGIFITGTAGAGKSLLSASLADWLKSRGENTVTVNLDPGVLKLPYDPDVDIRDYVSIERIMEKYHLGPNGALIMSIDLVADHSTRLSEELESFNPKYAIIDTPGQMELFAFRASGPFIARELKLEQKLVLYLFDAPFCSSPFNYVSTMFLSTAVYLRLVLPQLNVLSKTDLIPKDAAEIILNWATSPDALQTAVRQQPGDLMYLLAKDIFQAVSRLRMDFSLIACSAKTLSNFVNLHATIERVFTHGEKE